MSVLGPLLEPRYRSIFPALVLVGETSIKSSYPSSLMSPAAAIFAPNSAFENVPFVDQLVAAPAAEPAHMWTLPE